MFQTLMDRITLNDASDVQLRGGAADRIRNLFASHIDINMRCLLSSILDILLNDRNLHQLVSNSFAFINRIKKVIALPSPPGYITSAMMMHVDVKHSGWQYMTFVTWNQFEELLTKEGNIKFPSIHERIQYNRELSGNKGSIFSRDSLQKLINKVTEEDRHQEQQGQLPSVNTATAAGVLQTVSQQHEQAIHHMQTAAAAAAAAAAQQTSRQQEQELQLITAPARQQSISRPRPFASHTGGGYVSRMEQMMQSVQQRAERIQANLAMAKQHQSSSAQTQAQAQARALNSPQAPILTASAWMRASAPPSPAADEIIDDIFRSSATGTAAATTATPFPAPSSSSSSSSVFVGGFTTETPMVIAPSASPEAEEAIDDIFSTIDKKMTLAAASGVSASAGVGDMNLNMDIEDNDGEGMEPPELRSGAWSYAQRAQLLESKSSQCRSTATSTMASLRLEQARKDRLFVAEDVFRARTQEVLRGPGTEEVVVEGFDIPVTRRLFRSLRPYTWLNDEIINYYMSLLQDRNDKLVAHYKEVGTRPDFKPSHFYNNFFIDKLLDNENRCYTYSYVRRWSKRFDTFAQDKIFCPVNIKNSHWTLCVIYIHAKRICYYDSMGGTGKRYVDGLFQYLQDEHMDKKKTPLPDLDSWSLEYGHHNVCPQQENGTDCGVFTICNADYLSDDLPLEFTQDQITSFWRMKIAGSILRKTLNYKLQ